MRTNGRHPMSQAHRKALHCTRFGLANTGKRIAAWLHGFDDASADGQSGMFSRM